MANPTSQNGFRTALLSLAIGFILYLLIQSFANQFGFGELSVIGLTLYSIFSMAQTFKKMNYWSLAYLAGWLFAVYLLGPYLLSSWEVGLLTIIGSVFFIDKLLKKW